MDITLSDEQRLLKETAVKFAKGAYSFQTLATIRASADGFSRKVWNDIAELGWLALPLPQADGGLGGGMVDVGLIMEVFGKALLPEPFISTIVLGAKLVAGAGNAAQRARFLPGILQGETLLAFAHSEHGTRSEPTAIAARADRSPSGWVLTGGKVNVLGGPTADYFVVSARLQEDGLGLFLVPADTHGISAESFRTIDGQRASNLTFADVAVCETALLGDPEDRSPLIAEALDHAVLASVNAAVGSMEALLEKTADYLKTRVQFGEPLSKRQALRHRVADMAIRCEEARAIVQRAMLLADGSIDEIARMRAVSAAKAKSVRAAQFVGAQAVQLHGAMGVTEELDIGSYFRSLIAFELRFGSADYHRRRFSALAVAAD